MKFSPGIYDHAARIIGQTPWEVSRSGTRLLEAHRAAWKYYQHPLVVAGIDVYNLEAEAYGAVVGKPMGNNVPAIVSHPFSELGGLIGLPLLEPSRHERIREVLAAAGALRETCSGSVVRVPVCGPFALAAGLLGMEQLLIGLMEDEQLARAALEHLLQGQIRYLRAIRDAGGLPVIFESGTTPPLLPPRLFLAVEAPMLRRLFAAAESLFGERPPCIIGGDAALIAEALLNTAPGFVIAPSETDQAEFLRVASHYPHVHVRVNIAASVLSGTDFRPVQAEAERVIKLAAQRQNVSVGCGVVPVEAKPDMVCRLRDFVENFRET